MFKVFILSILLTAAFGASAQGSWNIGYIQIDSISSKEVSRLVKIDFKNKKSGDSKNENTSIRRFVDTRDTGHILIWNNHVELIERRKIYPDHGSYSEQFLECPNYESSRLLRVYENEIMEVKEDSILFRLHIEIYYKRKGKIHGEPYRDAVLCWIKKGQLDGVLIKE